MAETGTKLPVRNDAKPAPAAPAPWAPFESLRREIDRVFENFGTNPWRLPFNRTAFELDMPWQRSAGWNLAPAFDVAEKDAEYEITAELPGLDEKAIEIKLANGALTIHGEKKEEKEEVEKDYHLSERRYGAFTRSFRLPEGVDADRIDASFAKGVLTVKLPKTAAARQSEKTISVKAS